LTSSTACWIGCSRSAPTSSTPYAPPSAPRSQPTTRPSSSLSSPATTTTALCDPALATRGRRPDRGAPSPPRRTWRRDSSPPSFPRLWADDRGGTMANDVEATVTVAETIDELRIVDEITLRPGTATAFLQRLDRLYRPDVEARGYRLVECTVSPPIDVDGE